MDARQQSGRFRHYLLVAAGAVLVIATVSILDHPPRAQENQPRDRPHAVIDRNPDVEKKSVDELIDMFAEIKHPIPEFYSNFGSVRFVLVVPDHVQPQDGKIPPAMQEIVRRGLTSLPKLLEHLSDDRKSKFGDDDPLRVGDWCYVALGQILNQRYCVLNYASAWGPLIVESPVEKPELAKALREKWGRLTAKEHEKLLVDAALNTTPHADTGALQRLCIFYPNTAEEIALKLLRRPLYDHSKLWEFLMYSLATEPDETKWQPLIAEYLRENGPAAGEVLPLWLHWIYFETHSARTPQFQSKQAVARRILAKLFPGYKRESPAFLNAASIRDHNFVMNALQLFHSHRVDDEVHRLFATVSTFAFATDIHAKGQDDSVYKDQFAELCCQRLLPSRHGDTYRQHLIERIAGLEAQPRPDWQEIDHWHQILTRKRKSVPLSPEELQIAEKLKAMGGSADDEYGLHVFFSQEGEEKPVGDEVLELIAQFPRVRRIVLEHTAITDDGLGHLQKLKDVVDLELSHTKISSHGLTHFRRFSDLECLELAHTQVGDEGLAHIAGFKELRRLTLEGCPVTDMGLAHLPPLTAMEELDLSGTKVTGKGLRHIQRLTKLKVLDLAGCAAIADADIQNFVPLEKLERLTLDSPTVGDAGLTHLYGLKKLAQINLYRSRATPQGITRLRAALPETAVDYYWDCRWSQDDAGVLLTTEHVKILLEDAELKRLTEQPNDCIGPMPSKLNLCGGHSASSYRSGSESYALRGSDDGASVTVTCAKRGKPETLATYAFSFKGNGAVLLCGQQKFDLPEKPVTIAISPEGMARMVEADPER